MDISNMHVNWVSDLKDYGYTEDGKKFIGYIYFIEVDNERGERWRLKHAFNGVEKQRGENGTIFIRKTEEAISMCKRIVSSIKNKGTINLDYWAYARPAYGSDAYMEYGQDEDLADERMEY